MPVTALHSPSKGVYNFTAPGAAFTVVDAWSMADLYRANGVLVVDKRDDSFVWCAGQVMRAMFEHIGPHGSLKQGADALAGLRTYIRSPATESHKVDNIMRAMAVCATDGVATSAAADFLANARIFALPNNLDTGYGFSASRVVAAGNVSGVPDLHYGHTDARSAGSVILGTGAALDGRLAALAAVGVGVIRIPYMRNRDIIVNAANKYDHLDKPEVREKLAEAIDRAIAATEELVGENAYLYVPVEFRSGRVLVRRPVSEGPPLGAMSYWPGVYVKHDSVGFVAVPHGNRKLVGTHVANDRLVLPAFVSGHKDFLVREVSSIDGIPIQNIVGGLAQVEMADYQNRNPVSTSTLRSMYGAAIQGVNGLPARGAATDEQYVATLSAAAATGRQSIAATRLPSWDDYGAGPSLPIVMLATAIQPDLAATKAALHGMYPSLINVSRGLTSETYPKPTNLNARLSEPVFRVPTTS